MVICSFNPITNSQQLKCICPSDHELGEPYMDVVLSPGDILYVPRGCVHATSTPVSSSEPSMHMTVGMEALWDKGIGNTWESALGSGMVYRHSLIIESYYRALAFRKDKDMRFRETVPRSIREGVPTDADREYLRKLLYSLADTMVEDEHVLGCFAEEAVSSAIYGTISKYNLNLRRRHGI
eukprot:gene6159-9202_t